MKTKTLLIAFAATALLGGPDLVAGASSESASSGKCVKAAGMDKCPVAVKKVFPDYPREFRELGIQGTVIVDMVVDSTGRVVSAKLVSTTAPEFSRLALMAAKEWTFVPASANGKPVTARVQVPFTFVMPQLVAMGEY